MRWRGQPALFAQRGDVELAECLYAVGDGEYELIYQLASSATSDEHSHCGKILGSIQALLPAHEQDRRRLAIRHSPVGTANRCDRRPSARQTGPDLLALDATNDFVDDHSLDGSDASDVVDGDVNAVVGEVGEARALKGRDPVDDGYGLAHFEDSPPAPGLEAQVASVQCDGLLPVQEPSSSPDLSRDGLAVPTVGAELTPAHNAVVRLGSQPGTLLVAAQG